MVYQIKLGRLIVITRESQNIATEVIPLLVEVPLSNMPLNKINNLRHFSKKLLKLTDNIILSDETSLNEVAQSNYEFLDTVNSILFLILPHFNELNSRYIKSLQSKTEKLIAKLNSPPFLQHCKSRKLPSFFSDDENPDKLPEPITAMLIFSNLCSR